MAEPPFIPAWSATRAGLVLDGALTISFQRFLLEGRARLDAPPASLGALEPGIDGGGAFLIPLHPGEAIWIGIEGGPQWPAVRATARLRGEARDLASGRPAPLARATPIPCDPRAVVPGLARGDGAFLPLADPGLRLAFEPIAASGTMTAPVARVELVAADDFPARAGRAPPASARPENGYRGWRLP